MSSSVRGNVDHRRGKKFREKKAAERGRESYFHGIHFAPDGREGGGGQNGLHGQSGNPERKSQNQEKKDRGKLRGGDIFEENFF